jgi:hypothetical protein
VLLQRGVGEVRSLDCTYRLPADTAEVVQGFYDFAFTAKSKHGERRLLVEHKRGSGAIGQMLASARETTMLAGVRAMPKHGSVPDDDPEIAADAGAVVRQLLESKAKVDIDGRVIDLDPSQVGVCATHRVMLSSIRERMPRGADQVRIDTPERWQGLERPVMVVVHPLSSTTAPSEFDMGTGRLCVMSSRHKAALVVLSRDHVPQTLMENLPDATQAPNCVDAVGRSHSQQTRFWGSLAREGAMFRLDG